MFASKQSSSDGVSMPKGAQPTENTKVFSFGDFTASPKADEPDISGAEQFMLLVFLKFL